MYTTFCLSFHLSVDTGIASTLLLSLDNATLSRGVLAHLTLTVMLGGGNF